jgi:hypothetical protein
MNDPKVEKLYYRFLSIDPDDKFVDAQTLEFTKQGFKFRLENGMLTIIPDIKYSNPEELKPLIEPILKAWEFAAFIRDSRHRIRFVYRYADVIDLKPDPKNITIMLHPAELVATGHVAKMIRTNSLYPNPDNNYSTSALTEELVDRLKTYIDGRETLPSMSYYILDRVEYVLAGKTRNRRKKISELLKIDWNILNRVGELSNRSDTKIGRHGNREPVPLTQDQIHWLEKVSFRLVERLAEYNQDPNNLVLIMMKDFGPCPK